MQRHSSRCAGHVADGVGVGSVWSGDSSDGQTLLEKCGKPILFGANTTFE